MGVDKANLEIDGETLLARTVRIACAVSEHVMVIGRQTPTGWHNHSVRFLLDDQPGLGPIGGLKTALSHGSRQVMLLSCDLPCLRLEFLEWLIASARRSPRSDAVISQAGTQIHPLLGIYRPSSLDVVTDRISHGRNGMIRLLDRLATTFVQIPEFLEECATNVNTTGEWEEVGRTRDGGEQ